MIKQEILNQEEQDQELSTVLSAFSSIYQGKSKQISYSDTYNLVYKLCKKGQAESLLNNLTSISVSHFTETLTNFNNESTNIADYVAMIKKVQEAIERLSEILLYMDSNYVGDGKREHGSVKEILNAIFFQALCKNKEVLGRIAELIAGARASGNESQVVLLIEAVNYLDEKEVFLPQYLLDVYSKTLSDHYKQLLMSKYQSLGTKQFFLFAAQKLQQQREWIQKYFMRVKGKKLVQELMRRIYESSFNQLKQQIYKEKEEQLFKSATLQFLQLLNQKNEAKEINDFNDWYIEQIKKRLVKIDRADNTKFLKAFIKEYLFITDCLSGVKSFNIGYKATFFFENWINEEKLCLPKRLNIYFQDLIVKNESHKQDLHNFTILFKFLKEKDYFQKQFRRACALRMIYDPKKSNSDMENSMLTEMANQCGADWIQKLKNLKIASEESKALQDSFTGKFSAVVFEDAVWPFQKLKNPPAIPQCLLHLSSNFKAQYEQKYKGRALEWHPLQGYTVLKIKFTDCIQQFKMDTVMATILLNLQKFKFKSTVKQVLELTKLSIEDATDQLQLLHKQKIVLLDSPSQLQKSSLALNLSYTPLVSPSPTLIDYTQRYLKQQFIQKHGHEELKAQRKMMVQAFIIKIMKANKTLNSQEMYTLITPMIEGRGFRFNREFVDAAFAGLIDKRYIKDLGDGTFSYLAS